MWHLEFREFEGSSDICLCGLEQSVVGQTIRLREV